MDYNYDSVAALDLGGAWWAWYRESMPGDRRENYERQHRELYSDDTDTDMSALFDY